MNFKKSKKFYQKSINEFGVSAKGVRWNSKANQYKRFEAITYFIKDDIKNSEIVDAGCGFAEYYNYLTYNNLLPKRYIGVDSEKIMIEKSKKRFEKIELYEKNILKDKLFIADYYVCSGALNTLSEDEFFEFVISCFYYSKKGFIFNFLTEDTFTKIDKEYVKVFCKELSSKIKIKDDYLYNDMTIFLEK